MMLPWQLEWRDIGNLHNEAPAWYRAEPRLAYVREWEMKRFYNFKGDICPDRLERSAAHGAEHVPDAPKPV